MTYSYPIGRSGEVWNEDEKAQWFAAQSVKRSYQQEVVDKLALLSDAFTLTQYGALPIDEAKYALYAIVPANPNPALPDMLITGGVHGYETSGVQGAIEFALKHAEHYVNVANIYVLPCISPWGYETINRWNPKAIDPNRSFKPNGQCDEANAAMEFVSSAGITPQLHIDLHETTDTDNTEFRPALCARDAIHQDVWDIPDGFYLVADTHKQQLAFQQAITGAVEKVTHLAPADSDGKIIGAPILGDGIIAYDKKALFLCAGMTDAPFVTTTEVYPDSPRTTATNCNLAQVKAVCAAVDYVLSQHA